MKKLLLNNTLSKSKEEFSSKDEVKMYVCGITPYDDSHIGHGRCYVVFDVLYRFLKMLGYQVNYVRNFTDIDDKLLVKEKNTGKNYKEIADTYIKKFHEDMCSLGCLSPTNEPRVTENMDVIINFIKELVDQGSAYVVNHDVYFDTTKFKDYGKFSSKNLDDLISGARVEVSADKKSPADFALWKGNDQNLFWNSPWGYGRPGWHIECSALIKKFLGDSIDIHGGGADLIFPHHENEVAQSESLTKKNLSRFWVHNAFVNVNKEKMSKSLGNMFIMREVFKKFDPMVLRYYYLQHHYSTPIDFSLDSLSSVKVAYSKLVNTLSDHSSLKYNDDNPIIKEMFDALCDDLNTAKVIAIAFDNLSKLKDAKVGGEVKSFLIDSLGLTLSKLDQVDITPEIQKLIKERDVARASKDWKRADQIRDKLKEMGFEVQDKKI